jgi:hypothetical protein
MKRLFSATAVLSLFVMGIFVSLAAFAATEKAAPKSKQESKVQTESSAWSSSISGKVVETMNSGGYTYVCLEKAGKKTWVAVPEMKVAVGQEMAFQPGSVMHDFPSKSLNRTFESIIFSGGPATSQSSPSMPAGHGGAGNAATGGSKAAVSSIDKDIKVKKAAGKDAYTVGEIFEKREKLDQKNAVVRGKVVKVSAGIMGKNWIHLQDGTGNPQKGTHDLVVTSEDVPSVGDVVTVKGTIFKDKDFGAGYKYNVIMEKASISKQ